MDAWQPRDMLCAFEDPLDDFLIIAPPPGTLDIFTDGSALRPQECTERIATWGIVLGNRHDVQSFTPIAAGRVSGLLQTVLRAEIHAAISAVRFASSHLRDLTIWIDNETVVRRLREFASSREKPASIHPNALDFDLWACLWEEAQRLIETNSLIVMQVYSHQEISLNHKEFEIWASRGNEAANGVAKHARTLFPSQFWAKWEQVVAYNEWRTQLRTVVNRVICDVGASAITKRRWQPQAKALREVPPDGEVALVCAWPEVQPVLPREVQTDALENCLRWLRQLGQLQEPEVWISWVQLYIHFWLQTGIRSPCWSTKEHRWMTMSVMQRNETSFLAEVHAFAKYVQRVCRHMGIPCQPRQQRPFSHVIASYAGCLRIPFRVAVADEIDEKVLSLTGQVPVRKISMLKAFQLS